MKELFQLIFDLMFVSYQLLCELLEYLEQFIPRGILIFLGGIVEFGIVLFVIPTLRAHVIPAEPMFVLATQGLFWAGVAFALIGIAFMVGDGLSAVSNRIRGEYY